MKIGKIHSWKKIISQLILLAVPTAALAFYVLWDVNRFYAILQNAWLKQGVYFTCGIILSTIFYGYRFRFVTTAVLLFLIYYIIYKIVGGLAVGEFDAFFASVEFLIFTILFSVGWITGFGFSRSKYFTVFWSVFLLAVQIVVVSKTSNITANALISAFAPVLAYSFYIIYTAELIRNMNEDETGFAWFIVKRLLGFGLVMLVLLLCIFNIFQQNFKSIEKEWGGSLANYDKNKGSKESMTKENKDGSVSNKDQTRLTGSLNKGKRLVFVARLDNFFADGKTPNPLYFTAYYYTKFDTATQTFETDSLMPSNDLFKPDPSKILLYFAKTDSTVIKNTHATLDRKVVTTDVYKVLLSPDEYIAPSTAFFCQPISVDKEYKDIYKSAYRAKMWVSDLNSAYFIYNPAGNESLEAFQEQRFSILRKVTDFSSLDKKFLNYYTFMPRDEEYEKISELAHQITANAKTPIDKMLAIRNYFLSKDEFGQPLFKYTDNPGIPGMPSANKLTYFLIENRKGYCAYFAGATLFMLRSLGIPSRVAAGFLTVDRSSKNPGWYWFYEDQAHAWTQVYFPGYGWIDFDTTIPDVNTQQSPQPDQTPPMDMQQAYLVADGIVTNIDTITKRVEMNVNNLMYHEKNYPTSNTQHLQIDASIASVSNDTGTVKLSDVKKNMHITAASFADTLKNINADDKDSILSIFKKIPNPVPIDEIKIIEESAQQKQNITQNKINESIDWLNILWATLIIIAGLILLVFASPWIIWQYLNLKAKQKSNIRLSAFNKYYASLFYLNQLGLARSLQGPQQYAQNIDEQLNTNFYSFSNVYQKIKYSSINLSEKEKEIVNEFYPPFIKQIKQQIPFKKRFDNFLNIYHTINFFNQPKI
ncbi:MAG: transglutaminase domain-containing protein [Chitinophagaceae bacterium]